MMNPGAPVTGVDKRAPLTAAPAIWWLFRSVPVAHSIANSTSSATMSRDEYGSGPSSAAK